MIVRVDPWPSKLALCWPSTIFLDRPLRYKGSFVYFLMDRALSRDRVIKTVQFVTENLWHIIWDSYLSGVEKFFEIFISDEFLIIWIFWIDKLGRGITANDSMGCPSWPSPTKPKLRDVKVMKIRKFSKILNFTCTMPSTTKNELISTHSFLLVGN